MRRFFFDPQMRTGDRVTLSHEESYHIVKVLRLQAGVEIEVMDGIGGVFTASVLELGPQVVVQLLTRLETTDADRLRLWVGQGFLKGKKMDGAIQQCTELGVARLTPFFSSRCQGRLDDLRGRQKSERWNRIVASACKQCKRTEQMHLDDIVDYSAMVNLPGHDSGMLRLIFWEEEKEFRLDASMTIDRKIEGVSILLGPEGGFSRTEIAIARDLGWKTVSLGSRILRAETATVAAVAVVQHLVGNL
jgi:16S rRNA (uracil1498-N3)-methyltransferase